MFKIVHVSDLHLRKGWYEEQAPLLNKFFEDLKGRELQPDRDIFIFSGDLVQAGSSIEFINEFEHKFGKDLDQFFVQKNRLFCPGNHDVDRSYVINNLSLLYPKALSSDSETQFNDEISQSPLRELIKKKFSNILKLSDHLFGSCLSDECFTGNGFEINSECSVYILNTALYSFGGAKTTNGDEIKDKKLLRVDTRSLHKWLQSNGSPLKILIAHHPLNWLVPWAQQEMEIICNNNFNLLLQGHEHSPDVFARSRQNAKLVISSSPALHTFKDDPYLGYSVLTVDHQNSLISVHYRQWARKDQKYVSGTVLSGTDDGTQNFPFATKGSSTNTHAKVSDEVALYLIRQLNDSIGAYKSLTTSWVEPRLAKLSEFDSKSGDTPTFGVDHLLRSSQVAAIFAPQLFGLTTLGRHLALRFWEQERKFLLFANVSDIPGHDEGITQYVTKVLNSLNLQDSDLAGFVLDAGGAFQKQDLRRVNGIHKLFPTHRLYMLQRLPYISGRLSRGDIAIDFPHDKTYLHSMDRDSIRSLVRAEIQTGKELDEDNLTQRVVDDLDVLNIHRTPLHVKTLLAIAKVLRDNSPVNRTQMLSQFLLIIFRNNINFSYETFPDVTDSAYALGAFCAGLLKSGTREFTKREFLDALNAYCKKKAIDLDVEVIFELLARERVLLKSFEKYYFNYTHWIYFFAAHHMYADEAFRLEILNERQYANFPEVIEFYSGLDRQRTDLIQKLTEDLASLRGEFERKSQIPRNASIHDHLRWKVDPETLKDHLAKFLSETELPTSVKDQIADEAHDYSKPYSQELRNFVNDGLARTIFLMMAAARALRNSDHVERDEKRELLLEILAVWKQLVQLATLLAPEMMNRQFAKYDDVIFITSVTPDESMTFEQNVMQFLGLLPTNAARIFFSDLSSKRMGPLFSLMLKDEQDELVKYFLAMQVLLSKPKGWVGMLSDYTASLPRNSFYLHSLFNDVEADYRDGFNSVDEKDGLKILLGKVLALHQLNITNPNKKTMESITKKLDEKLEPPKDTA